MKAVMAIGGIAWFATDHRGTVMTRRAWRVWEDGSLEWGYFHKRGWYVDGVKRIEFWFEWQGAKK